MRKRRKRKKWWIPIIILLAAAAGIFFCSKKYFRIKEINISGSDKYTKNFIITFSRTVMTKI